MAVDHWRSYLQPAEFIIQTDQKSLIHLDDQRLNYYWQQKALTKLLGLQYKISYKQGSTNKAADALSRLPHLVNAESLAISVAQPTWLQELQDTYSQHDQASKLLTSLLITPTQDKFTLVQGIIRYKRRIWLSHSPELQNQVMQALHDSSIGGHSGFLVTYIRIKRFFFWLNMKTMIQSFVAACAVCQQAKTERVPYQAFYNLYQFQIMLGKWLQWTSSRGCHHHLLIIVS